MIFENLKELRKTHNLTIKQLSQSTGLNALDIESWEMGDAFPEIEDIRKLSSFYSVPIDEIIFEKNFESIEIGNLTEKQKKIIRTIYLSFLIE